MQWRYKTDKKTKRIALTGFLIIVSVLPIFLNFMINPAKAQEGYLIEQNGINNINSQKSLTKLSNGTLIAIFTKTDEHKMVYFKKSNDGGHTWIGKIALSSSGNKDAMSPSVAVDSSDNIYVVWYEYSTDTGLNYIELATYYSNTKSWASPENITSPYIYDAWEPSIAVDGNDVVHVATSGYNSQSGYYCVWYLKYVGSSWTTPIIIAGGDNVYESYWGVNIGVDRSNNLHTVFSGYEENYQDYAQVFYVGYDGTWLEPVRLSTASGMDSIENNYPTMCIDYNNKIYVAWSTISVSLRRIYYTVFSSSWSTPQMVDNATVSDALDSSPSLSVNNMSMVVIIWRRWISENSTLLFSLYYNNIWHTPSIFTTGDNGMAMWSRYPSFTHLTSIFPFTYSAIAYGEISPNIGILSITANLPNGEVYINGTYRGQAPLNLTLATGNYTVHFGGIPWYITPPDKVVNLKFGQTINITGTYLPAGKLRIDSTPVKGSITVNGTLWGIGPQYKNVTAGHYLITFGNVEGYITPPSQFVYVSFKSEINVSTIYVSNLILALEVAGLGIAALLGFLGIYLVIRRSRRYKRIKVDRGS